ncbi:MAG: carbohydrate ABC transporter permease [Chloroflexi bacterium]|nr:carbohydrate ABC transporter permease [Chloroflexota bacterium]
MKSSLASRTLLTLLVALIVLVYGFPYAFLVSTSLKSPQDALAIPPTLLPQQLSLENYANIGEHPTVQRSFGNSAIIALLSTVITIALAVPAAYAVARYGAWAGKAFLFVVLITRLIPPVAVGIPLFVIMRALGLIDTHLGVALAHSTISVPLGIWLLASFMESIPRELEEAARVDGCSRFGALLRIIIPVASGGIAVTAIFVFLASWNEFLFSLLLSSTGVKTAPIAIAEFKTQYSIQWGTMTSLAVLFSFPVIIFSLLMQKRIIAGLTVGAVKG